ncbi:unnamed protein product [Cylindrotheca closterium]|uniref:Uncharacterized protein n=1 Tax=Cylindrotheca closterium TaxID=2856 RepID=A0AAD2CCY1_9STRA|nr:unnamed protein product [Cylindrotheca closterium]
MPILRGSLFQRRNRNWFGRGKQERTKKHERTKPDAFTLSTITETEDDDINSTTTENYNDRLPTCISFLSNDDTDHHREGLNQLLEIVRDKKQLSQDASMSLIYGESDVGKKLQLVFLPFLTAKDNDDDDDDDEIELNDEVNANDYESPSLYFSESSEEFVYEDEDDLIPRGLGSGRHHEAALLILLYALGTVSILSDAKKKRSIDFASPFWQPMIQTVIDNMESNYTEGITTMTLSCLRILYTLEPAVVGPFLKHLLLPYISSLREYGHRHELPIMQREASSLLSLTASNFSPQ